MSGTTPGANGESTGTHAGPTGTHALAKAALHGGLEPLGSPPAVPHQTGETLPGDSVGAPAAEPVPRGERDAT